MRCIIFMSLNFTHTDNSNIIMCILVVLGFSEYCRLWLFQLICSGNVYLRAETDKNFTICYPDWDMLFVQL